MSSEAVELRRGLYADSVALMVMSRQIGMVDGVSAALVAMATDLNIDLLTEMGFTRPTTYSANELLVAIRARDEATLRAAIETVRERLEVPQRARGPRGKPEHAPRTIGAAVRDSGPGLALISVPGPHAFAEAMDALESGCDVMLFSNNVGVADEVRLKEAAGEHDLLVMGPDCGTAVVGGIGLGFSHTLDRGPLGVVAASGTGAQQLLCLLDAAGVGVSAALGVGGRDLSDAVGGRSTLTALRLLDADPSTERIVVISKPPSASVSARVRAFAAGLKTPTSFALLGPDQPDLTAATEEVLRLVGRPVPAWSSWIASPAPARGALRGLFCGGTLCDEAMRIASGVLGPIRSNVPLRTDWVLDPSLRSDGHVMIDFGDETLTRGRAHPMIDPTLRTQHLRSVLADRATGVVLLDVVLGHGSHPDPVAELAPVIAGSGLPVVVSLIGARRDPQGFDSCVARLRAAGASIHTSNAAAARHAVSLLQRGGQG